MNPLPKDTLELDEIIFPSVQVLNSGIDTFKNLKICVIIKNSLDEIIYRDSFELVQLPPNRASNFSSIQEWESDVSGDYTMHSWFKSLDDNSSNDSLVTSFVIVKRRDAVIESIEFPNMNLYKQRLYKPVVNILNDGLDNLSRVNLSCKVKVGSTTIYNKNKIIDVLSGQSLTIDFDSTLTYDKAREAQAIFVIEALDDQVSSNDTMTTSFNFIQGLGVHEYSQSDIITYPNPFEKYVMVSAENPISSLRLMDMFGRVVYEYKDINQFIVRIDLDVLKGLYILEIRSDNEWYKIPITRE